MGGKILRRTKKSLIAKIKCAKKIIFFLDYDGTITPIKKKPRLAKIGKKARALLKILAKKKWAKVFILSGRSLQDVKRLVGLKTLYYIGNHGLEAMGPALRYVHPQARKSRPYVKKAYRDLKARLKQRGVLVEDKNLTLSLHYRLADKRKIPLIKKAFWNIIGGLVKEKKIKITEGKKVLEVRPNIKWDKGKIVTRILGRTKRALPICIGDDKTDEDAFNALGKEAVTILVSEKPKKTKAKYRLGSPKEVLRFLKTILEEKNIR